MMFDEDDRDDKEREEGATPELSDDALEEENFDEDEDEDEGKDDSEEEWE